MKKFLLFSLVAWRLVAQPVITTQPASQLAVYGGSATFTVTATGSGPFTYQWQHNGTNLPNNSIVTVAGNGTTGFSGDGGSATNAQVTCPCFVATGGNGDFYITQFLPYSPNISTVTRIRKVDSQGIITTVAGGGSSSSFEGGQATNANLTYPLTGIDLDSGGNIFFSGQDYARIYKIDTNGIISRFASIIKPQGVAVNPAGMVFIACKLASCVYEADVNGVLTKVAGNGTAGFSGDGGQATNASLNWPNGVGLDTAGNLFIADMRNHTVRKVDTNGIITLIAGMGTNGFSGDGGIATNAKLSGPRDVTVDAQGNVFIADFDNNRVRMVDTNGIITTIAGTGTNGYAGDGGPAARAKLTTPTGVRFDKAGNLYIADFGNHAVRKLAYTGVPQLRISPATAADAGDYSVIISNAFGSVTSSVVTLNLQPPPAITPSFASTNGICTLNWNAVSNFTYLLQMATNLNASNWQNLTNAITITNGTATFDCNVSQTQQRFYRVQVFP